MLSKANPTTHTFSELDGSDESTTLGSKAISHSLIPFSRTLVKNALVLIASVYILFAVNFADCKGKEQPVKVLSTPPPPANVLNRGMAMVAANSQDTVIDFPVQFKWMIPSDSMLQVNNVEVIARISSRYPIQSIKITVDSIVAGGYGSANVPIMLDSELKTWGYWIDFFINLNVYDRQIDTGWHRVTVEVTDSLGNQNVGRSNIHLERSIPNSYWIPISDTIKVNAGWNLIGTSGRAVSTSQLRSVPGGLINSPVFGFGSTYTPSDSLRLGRGYWIRMSKACLLVIDKNAIPQPLPMMSPKSIPAPPHRNR